MVQKQLASIVRVRTETMFLADDTSGATIKLLLLPLGQQAGGSLSGDEQLGLAKYFFDASPGSPEEVAKAMTASASRSPTVTKLARAGSVAASEAADGARYVRYGYDSTRCSEPLDDGECFGELLKKRSTAVVAMSSLSQYRTNTERQRMQELGQERNVNVLWLLTLTAPADAWSKFEAPFEAVAASFRVPLKPPTSE